MCFIWGNEAMGPTGLFLLDQKRVFLWVSRASFFMHLFLYQKSPFLEGKKVTVRFSFKILFSQRVQAIPVE